MRRRHTFRFLNIASIVVPLAVVSLVLLGRWRENRLSEDVRRLLETNGTQIHAEALALLDATTSARKSALPVPREELPAVLQLPGVNVAIVASDHVQLLRVLEPDRRSGFRIWRRGQPQGYDDEPTAEPSTFRFAYSASAPQSPSNRPD